jgi:hypothetical protein
MGMANGATANPQVNTNNITISKNFKLVFLTVVGITLISFIGQGLLALIGNNGSVEADLSVFQRNFYNACNFGWQAGVGAILGLIGGKVA